MENNFWVQGQQITIPKWLKNPSQTQVKTNFKALEKFQNENSEKS